MPICCRRCAAISPSWRKAFRPRRNRAGSGDGLQWRNDRHRYGARPAGFCRRLRARGRRGGRRAARACDRVQDLIVFDMGGTTAKAAIVEGGEPQIVTEYEFRDGISSPSRFVKGAGYMLKVPAIDIAEVGSGGGSIARIDAGGLLVVGPESAGGDPGPACYGHGTEQPTVTDANMVLGFLNPHALAGGSLPVDAALASQGGGRACRAPARALGGGCGARHSPSGQCQHGACDPRGDGRARQGSPRHGADGVRRRRAPACG